jgi:hypothetical protein
MERIQLKAMSNIIGYLFSLDFLCDVVLVSLLLLYIFKGKASSTDLWQNFVFTIISIGMFGICLLFCFIEYSHSSYIAVPATVTKSISTFDIPYSLRPSFYETEISFTYQPSTGERLTGRKTFGGYCPYFEWGNPAQWDQYWFDGRDFTLYVNPNNPKEWSFEKGTSRVLCYMLTIFSVIAIGFCMLTFRCFFAPAKDNELTHVPKEISLDDW